MEKEKGEKGKKKVISVLRPFGFTPRQLCPFLFPYNLSPRRNIKMGMRDFKVVGKLGAGAFAAVTKVSKILMWGHSEEMTRGR